MIRRLRRKFVFINMALMCAMLVLILALQYRSTAESLAQSSLDALKSSAAMTGTLPGLRPGDGALHPSRPVFTIYPLDRDSLIVTGDDYYDLTDEDLLKKIYLAAIADGSDSGVLAEYSLRYYRWDTMWGTRYIFTDITPELKALEQMRLSCVLIGLAAFLGLLGVSVLLAHWAVRPVAKAWEQQRQFVADASHELKTPLTVILANAELLTDDNRDPETRSRLTESILTMSRQMRELVESLLQLARADGGQTREHMEPLELSALVTESLLPFEPVYYERGLTLESHITPGLRVRGSAAHLTRVVEILLDNCWKYSSPGSTVTLTLERNHGRCVLRLMSPGTPLTPQTCRDIFKRFYRADPARHAQGSYGLGLSIAQSIITDHGGKIWATPTLTGNLFTLTLPLLPPTTP